MARQKPFYGWAVVSVAAVVAFCSGPGQSYVFSIFLDPMIEETGFSRSLISTMYAVGTGLSAVMVMVVSRLADRYGARSTLIGIAFLLGLACFGMSIATAGAAFVVLFAALRALGQGSMPINGTLLAAQWFVRRRGVAIAMMGLGFAASNALLPPIGRALIDSIGWRETYLVFGAMVWVLVIPLAVFVVRNRPEDKGLYPDGASHPPAGEEQTTGPAPPDKRRILSSLTFWMLAVPLATPAFVITALIFHQTSIFGERGLSPTEAANVFVFYAISSALCSFGAGFLVDRFGPRRVFIGDMALLASATALALTLTSPAMAAVYTLMLGAAGGTAQVVSGVTWAHFYGRQGLGRVQGSATMVGISSAAIAPMPLAFIEGATDSFRLGILAMIALPIAAAITIAVAKQPAAHGTVPAG